MAISVVVHARGARVYDKITIESLVFGGHTTREFVLEGDTAMEGDAAMERDVAMEEEENCVPEAGDLSWVFSSLNSSILLAVAEDFRVDKIEVDTPMAVVMRGGYPERFVSQAK